MINKLEQKLDMEFQKMSTKLYIFHIPIRFIEAIANVTIIVATTGWSWPELRELVYQKLRGGSNVASRLLVSLQDEDIYGIAICDKRDQFNRQRGRIIAKGRLLKHLKETAK